MANYKNYKRKVDERVFSAVKILLESGNSQGEVAKYMKLSHDVVNMIANAENLAEYKTLMYERNQRKAARAINAKQAAEKKEEVKQEETPVQEIKQVVEHKQSVQIQATHYMETKLDKVIELLTCMNAKLGAIIDDLYGTGKGAAG